MSGGSVKKRLSPTVWVGNFGTTTNEYQVLKFAQQVGEVVKFDFMYHETLAATSINPDGDARVPRGYAFVTYSNYAVADEAIRKLNGQRIGGRQIRVQPATSDTTYNRPSSSSLPPGVPRSLSMSIKSSSSGGSKMSKEDKIRAMEMKLKALEASKAGPEQSSDFKVVIPGKPSSSTTPQAANSSRLKTVSGGSNSLPHKGSSSSKPYHRPQNLQSKR